MHKNIFQYVCIEIYPYKNIQYLYFFTNLEGSLLTMKQFVVLIFSLFSFLTAFSSSSILKVGAISSIHSDLVSDEKQLYPRKEGGVVMLTKDSLPEYIILVDSLGNYERSLKLDETHIDYNGLFIESGDVVQLSSGNYVLTTQSLNSNSQPYLKQILFSPTLEVLKVSTYNIGESYRKIKGIYNSKDDTYVCFFSTVSGLKKAKVVKFKGDGSVVWTREQNLPASVLAIQRSRFLAISDDNGYSYHTFLPSYVCTNVDALFGYWFLSYEIDIDGKIKKTFSSEIKGYPYLENDYPSIHGCALIDNTYKFSFSFYTKDNPFVRIHNASFPGNNQQETFTLNHVYGNPERSFLNEIGEVISFGAKHLYIRSVFEAKLLEIIPLLQSDIQQISYVNLCRRPEGGWWVSGYIDYLNGTQQDILIGIPSQNYQVSGKVFKDYTKDETFDGQESNYEASWVNFKSKFNYFSKIDSSGNFDLRLGEDEYDISVKTNSDIWELSENARHLNLNSNKDLNLPIQPKVICSEMTVNVVTPVLIRCQENTYEVNFSNSGSETASNAYVVIELDQHLQISQSSIPYEVGENGKVKFNLGNIAQDSSGQFTFQAFLNCDNTILGQTHCVTAKIYPNETCFEPQECWDGSIIEITGQCVNDTAVIEIKNSGERTIQDKTMYVLEDDIMFDNPISFPLDKNEIRKFLFNPDGKTIRIDVPQSECYPYKSMPSIVIEGCGGLNQVGLVRTLPQDDEDRFVSINCNESIELVNLPYLKADPKGYGEKQYISDSTELQYTYVFQPDFDYGLYLIDTISEFLNIETFKINSSSHGYDYTLFNNGVLKVDIRNQKDLPLGYFQYSFTPKKGVQEGSVVKKRAAFINTLPTPIMSNQVHHTIGYRFIELGTVTSIQEWKEKIEVQVYPNPFSQQFSINFQQKSNQLRLQVFNMSGQIILEQGLSRSNIISTEQWKSGNYIFRILENQSVISTGKLIKF